MSLSKKSRGILGLSLLIGGLFSRLATGQAIAPAGVHSSYATPSLCQSCSERVLAGSYEPEVAFSVARSRKAHVLLGLVGGLAVGVYIGAVRGRHDEAQCNSNTCLYSSLNDIVEWGLCGALLGTIVGAVWPIPG